MERNILVLQFIGQDAVQQFLRACGIQGHVHEELLVTPDPESHFGKACAILVKYQSSGALGLGQLGIQSLVDLLLSANQGRAGRSVGCLY